MRLNAWPKKANSGLKDLIHCRVAGDAEITNIFLFALSVISDSVANINQMKKITAGTQSTRSLRIFCLLI